MDAKQIKLIVGLVLAGLAIVVIAQNTAVVQLKLLFWTVEMSRALMFFLFLASGILMGWILRGRIRR